MTIASEYYVKGRRLGFIMTVTFCSSVEVNVSRFYLKLKPLYYVRLKREGKHIYQHNVIDNTSESLVC